jgi:hypothetical protein
MAQWPSGSTWLAAQTRIPTRKDRLGPGAKTQRWCLRSKDAPSGRPVFSKCEIPQKRSSRSCYSRCHLLASSCRGPGPACAYLNQADAIVLGRVASTNHNPNLGFVQQTYVRFTIEKAFKGLAPPKHAKSGSTREASGRATRNTPSANAC